MSALLTPRRSILYRGARAVLFDILSPATAPILVVHSRSATWADTAMECLRVQGKKVLSLTARGEPSLPQLKRALEELRPEQVGLVVAIGGGSAIDLGKALAALLPAPSEIEKHLEVVGDGAPLERAPLPFIALPTTAGTGAEATKNAVIDIPEHRRKVSLRDARMIPDIAILDPALTDNLPWDVTLMTGMDAVTQLIEPYLSTKARPETDALCRAAIGPALSALITLSETEDAQARDTLMAAAHFSGIALANAGLGAVHGLAGVIGGQTGLPHGAICARLLPAALEVVQEILDDAGKGASRLDDISAIVKETFAAPFTPASEVLFKFLENTPIPNLHHPALEDAVFVAEQALESSSIKTSPAPLNAQELQSLLARAMSRSKRTAKQEKQIH